MAKKPNAQDSTRRNVQASQGRDDKLARRVRVLERIVRRLVQRMKAGA